MIEDKTVSLCMVVKDEAATFERAASSFFDHVDEIVVAVDRTSSDDTLKLAKKWVKIKGAGTVIEFDWNDSFSEARNIAIEKCTSDWVLVVDGHEYLDPTTEVHLRDVFTKFSSVGEPDVFSFLIWMKDTPGQGKALQHRLFRQCYRYQGKLHNALDLPEEAIRVGVSSVTIIHDRPIELSETRAKQRHEMYERIFHEELKENPYSPRAHYYLGIYYSNKEKYLKAISHYSKYLKYSTNDLEKAKVLCFRGICYREAGLTTAARASFQEAAGLRYDCASAYIELGDLATLATEQVDPKDLYSLLFKIREAEFFYRCATNLDCPIDSIFLDADDYSWKPWAKLASLYERCVNDYNQVQLFADVIIATRKALSFPTVPPQYREELTSLYNYFLNIYKQADAEVRKEMSAGSDTLNLTSLQPDGETILSTRLT